MDPKASLPQTTAVDAVGDASTLRTVSSTISSADSATNASRNSSLSPSNYQVFILAGFGHNLYPLTEEDNLPKALLPMANTPLLYFPLVWCKKAGFADVTVVCHKESLEQIKSYTSTLSLDLEIKVEAPSSLEDNMGSADVMGMLKDSVTSDFIVLSCDSFTTLLPDDLLSFHANHKSSATAVFFDASQNSDLVNLKLKENDSSLYVGFEKETSRLLFLKSAIDVLESLEVRTSLLWRYPRVNVQTTLQDAHIYIFKRWVIDFIAGNEKISSLKSDLLPVLAKMQWQSALREREHISDFLPVSQDDIDTNSMLPTNLRSPSPISVSLYVTPPDQYTLRANSLPTYLLLNHHLALLAPDPKKHPSSKAGPKTSVGNDSLVGENCTLGERVQIRKSVLSQGVEVGSRTVIRGSVIMSCVSIGENAKIEGCVLCKGAKIEGNVSLTECFVGAGYVVEKGTKMAKQNLVELDALEDDDDEDEEEE